MEKVKGNLNWKSISKILFLLLLVWLLENISYFYVAEIFGNLKGVAGTHNLQLPIDRVIPWVTILYPFYITWPFTWVFVITMFITSQDKGIGFSRFIINNIMMYIVGSIIYAVFPTTTNEASFVDGTVQTLPKGSLFYNQIYALSQNTNNIWGSMPSYHNYFASLFIFFAVMSGVKKRWKSIMIIFGALITLSTLTLHQHCIMDVICTYSLTGLFLFLTIKLELDKKLENWILLPAKQ